MAKLANHVLLILSLSYQQNNLAVRFSPTADRGKFRNAAESHRLVVKGCSRFCWFSTMSRMRSWRNYRYERKSTQETARAQTRIVTCRSSVPASVGPNPFRFLLRVGRGVVAAASDRRHFSDFPWSQQAAFTEGLGFPKG